LRVLGAVIIGLLLAFPLQAKDPPLSAIALFDGTNGPVYVQITGVTINGKTELRTCTGVTRIDKKTYGAMAKVFLKGAASLERSVDGVLTLTADAGPICVVPGDLKFEKQPEFTLAEAAGQTSLQGTVVAASAGYSGGLPEFKPGVKIVFVAALDTELAEFLRAQRTGTISGWQDFLIRYGSASRATEARRAMAALYQEAADSALAGYRKSVTGHAPDFGHLKQAQQQAEQAETIVPGSPAAQKVLNEVSAELAPMMESARTELTAYRKALAENTRGHGHLDAAKKHIDQILDINARYQAALSLQPELFNESRKLEVAVQGADRLLAEGRQDEALKSLGPYRAFAPEMPRVEAIVDDVYNLHFDRGQRLSGQQQWEQAAAEFRLALEVKNGSRDAADALKNAEVEAKKAAARQATEQARQASKSYAEKQQWIEAYEVLAALPEDQQTVVAEELASLKPQYAIAALRSAQKLQETHLPIRGRADEDAVRRAYELLQRANSLSDDKSIRLKLDLLSDKIGSYYRDLALKYLGKPLGSGVGLGWLYLAEAHRYNPDLDAVKDDMTKYSGDWQLRARLSIGVIFRDQTSRRESAGFADQLADAVANGLEGSGLPVKVVRRPSERTDVVQPNFMLIGEILEHRTIKTTDAATLQSKYRAGVHDVKNEAWLKLDQELTTARQQLSEAQNALAAAQARRNKKEIADASTAVEAAQKQTDDLRHKLETTDATRPEAVIEPYNYSRKTIDLTAVTSLAFRITDPFGTLAAPPIPIKKENHKIFVLLENVKPEDTEGIKLQNVAPDEAQFLTDVEIQARESLIKSLQDRVSHLPERILEEARKRSQANDLDGAAEQYILYLNATPNTATPERDEAAKWLREKFNVEAAGK
jgi:hypothetical protein